MQELKGNIRVFCRVRPAMPGDAVALTPAGEPFVRAAESGTHFCILLQAATYCFPHSNCIREAMFEARCVAYADDAEGQGVELAVPCGADNVQKYQFSFDRVFPATAGQVYFHSL